MDTSFLFSNLENTAMKFNDAYHGTNLEKLAYPIGGFGAGMFCLDGTGAFSHFSLRSISQLQNEWATFSALALKTKAGDFVTRVIEGPVPRWKPVSPWNKTGNSAGSGCIGRSYGLPRFKEARFSARFPFAKIELTDDKIPLEIELSGWSPFVPGDADASSLPVGTVEYRFGNRSAEPVDFVYSFHSENFLAEGPEKHFLGQQVEKSGSWVAGIPGGFLLHQPALPEIPSAEASFAAFLDDAETKTDLAWFRGGWFDPLTMLWKDISSGWTGGRGAITEGKPSVGGSLYLPVRLEPGEERTVRLLLAWYAPYSIIREGYPRKEGETLDPKNDFYQPWYTSQFSDIESVVNYWKKNHATLREATNIFTNTFYDSTLPSEVIEAVGANLTILKSPTVLREKGGTLWGWEGTNEEGGSCHGSCTHVWNYAQAIPHLFPKLERSLREVEFNLSQDDHGHQAFRSSLPLGPTGHDFHAAADGQLGGMTKVYREWRISGDTAWLKSLWPKVRKSLDFCIETWDPEHRGVPVEPHHNTYDIEFWGPDGMCASFYLAALQAAVAMGRALGDDVSAYEKLLASGKTFVEKELFNGEYFIQKVQWTGLRATDPIDGSRKGIRMNYSTEATALLQKDGPKYQYGEGCLSDGVVGEWLAWASGLEPVLDAGKIESHLRAVHRHNFRADLSEHANPQRSGYAFGHDAGLLLCTWPRGGRLSLPFVYSEEVWTGIEYQVASHLISVGRVEEGLQIVRACRQRYDGSTRNPFDEFECGHWYARALASYALLQALTGARYDAIDRQLILRPRIAGDFRSFLAVEGGYGTVGVKDGKPFFDVRMGSIDVRKIEFTPWTGKS
jgi:uncharacterized protein (DUF608 family)